MGSDDLFKKKKIAKRRAPNRSQKDRVAIICEGTKTEPQYFTGLRRHLKINKTIFAIQKYNSGMNPSAIVTAARQ